MKGDRVKSRLVAQEFNHDDRDDIFAATPPLETLKFLVSLCARKQRNRRPYKMATIDIKRAYFYAPALRPVYVKLPTEDRNDEDSNRCGDLGHLKRDPC